MGLFDIFTNASFYDIIEKYEIVEFKNGDYFKCWDAFDVAKVARVDRVRLIQYVEEIKEHYREKNRFFEVHYNIHEISEYDVKFNIIGLWFLFDYLYEIRQFYYLKKYVPLLKSMSFTELLTHQQHLTINKLSKYNIQTTDKSSKKKSTNKIFEVLYNDDPEYFDNKNNYDRELLKPDFDIEFKDHIFYKKKVVITGDFEKFPKREDMLWLIKNVGGDNNVSISRLTNYVIVGENPGPKKMKLIKDFKIKTISENEFYELFNDWFPIDEIEDDFEDELDDDTYDEFDNDDLMI